MLRRSAHHLLLAGALSMGALLPGCHGPLWTGSSPARTCRRCELPCSWLSCFGFSRCIDDQLAQLAAERDALDALKSFPEPLSSKPDYRDGFIDAFQDVAIGHRGDLPALPPERYWNGCFRTGAKAELAQDWFAGYCDGAAQARQCYGLNQVQVSAAGYPPSPIAQPQGLHPHGMSSNYRYGPQSNWGTGPACPACEGGRP